jgi:pimeloyl-ACP methyl ester carboxylesterase
MTVSEKKACDIDGLTLTYYDQGQHDEVLLLVHGLGCSAFEWYKNIAVLSQSMRVIAVDLVGFGSSSRAHNFLYTPDSQAAMIIRLAQALGVSRFHVGGNSYGGLVAMYCAIRSPSTIKSIILINSAGGQAQAPLAMRLSTLPGLGELLTRPSLSGCRVGFANAMFDKSRLEEVTVEKNWQAWSVPGSKATFLKTLRGMIHIFGFKQIAHQGLSDRLKLLRVRALIIWGRNDPLLGLDGAVFLKDAIANSELVILEETGHAPMLEQPQLTNELIRKFILNKNVYES